MAKQTLTIHLENSSAPRNLVVLNDFNRASTHKDKKKVDQMGKRKQKHKGKYITE